MDSEGQSLQISNRRALKKGKGKVGKSGLSESDEILEDEGVEEALSYDLTWELVSFDGDEIIIQLWFHSPSQISLYL
jgi:hypothetical protein